MVEAETRSRKRGSPVVDDEQANDQRYQELDEIANSNRCGIETDRHGRKIPIRHHSNELDEANKGEQRHPRRRERIAVLGCEIGEVIGELVKPVDPGGASLRQKDR